MNDDTTQNAWHLRVADLSQYAGLTIAAAWIDADSGTGAGDWQEYFADIAFIRRDGTVQSIYNRLTNVSYPSFGYGGVTNQTFEVNIDRGAGVFPFVSTTYYVGDHLGSTRLELAGSGWPLSSSIFYPFGQEQTAGADPNHYKFTGKERDAESGLDNFGARYYGSSMGRFMSPDKPVDQHPEDPQSWNLYSYVRNNPLISIDQDGNYDCGQMTADQCTQFGNNLTAAQNQLAAAQKNGTITDAQFKQGSDALGAYGTLNDHNGVTVNVGATGGFPGTTSVSNDGTVSAANPTGQNIQVTFNPGVFGGNSDSLNGVIGHEGSHVEDGEAWAKAGFTDAANPTHFDTEFKAYGVTSVFGAAQGAGILRGTKPGDNTPHLIWERNFPDVVNNALRTNMIKTLYPNWAEKAFQANTNPEKK